MMNLNGYRTHYLHLQGVAVEEGDQVRAGQEIGLVGATGNAQGANLEMAMLKDGSGVMDSLSRQPPMAGHLKDSIPGRRLM